MKTVFRFSAAAAFGSCVLIAACHGNDRQANSATTTTTGADTGANESAVNSLVMARCDREELCNNVGKGKKYATRRVCVEELRDKARQDLRAADCPRGVDNPQLDKCRAEIRAERCGNPIDTITRLAACRTSALCPK